MPRIVIPLFIVSFLLTLGLIFNWLNLLLLSAFLFQDAYGSGHIILQPTKNGNNNNNTSTKVIILGFDDSPKSQFTLAKPILDKYGFKGSFFVVCNYVNAGSDGRDKTRMTWQDIDTLEEEGHDIESHSMTHTNLDMKSQQNLIYEIGESKQCLLDHVGVNPTIFAYPASSGHSNATVVNVVSQYYDLARTGDAPLAFLHCNGYEKDGNNCSLSFDKERKPTYENRYDIRNWSDRPHINHQDQQRQQYLPLQEQSSTNISYNDSQMFHQFVQEVNLEENYNKNGCINAIPIVIYHDFVVNSTLKYLSDKSYTDVGLFSAEMKYLHDNGFKVLKMSDIGYNQTNNYLYIKVAITALIKNC